MNFNQIGQVALQLLTLFGLKVLGAILIWLIAQRLIDFALKLVRRAFRSQQIDPTLINYLLNIIGVTLKIVLIVSYLAPDKNNQY